MTRLLQQVPGAPMVELAGVSRWYRKVVAVSDVSFRLEPGVTGLLGPNGAGKSTLINLLSGDLAPTSGSIRYKGVEIAQLPPERRSRMGLGRSYQKTNIFPTFTVIVFWRKWS